MPTVLEVATKGKTIRVEIANRVPKASAILGVEAPLLLGQTVSSSSNEAILTNPLPVLTVLEVVTKGNVIRVEVANRVPEVSTALGVYALLLLG